MDQYIENAIRVLSDPTQTITAKQTAHTVLLNAGLSKSDIEQISLSAPEEQLENSLMIFLA